MKSFNLCIITNLYFLKIFKHLIYLNNFGVSVAIMYNIYSKREIQQNQAVEFTLSASFLLLDSPPHASENEPPATSETIELK